MSGAMRRLLRILFNVATVLSLLLGVATAGLWVRSYSHFDTYCIVSDGHDRCNGVSSWCGEIWLFDVYTPNSAKLPQPGWRSVPPGVPRPWWYGYTAFDGFVGADHIFGWAQYWRYRSMLPLTLTLPAVLLVRRTFAWQRTRGDRQAGRCVTCHYDLRATPDRCPECGTIPV